MNARQLNLVIYASLSFFLAGSTTTWAQDASEIQRRLNAETLNKSFSVPSDAELTSALKEATRKGVSQIAAPTPAPACIGLGCVAGQNYGYGSYFGGYARPYYGGYYGRGSYLPYYYGW